MNRCPMSRPDRTNIFRFILLNVNIQILQSLRVCLNIVCEEMIKKKRVNKDNSRGVGIVLYRNSKSRWLSEPCKQELTTLHTHNGGLRELNIVRTSSVRQWLTNYCEDSSTPSIQVKGVDGQDFSIPFMHSFVGAKPEFSTIDPIDLSSIEDLKALKQSKKNEQTVFESCHGLDFDVYVNAGGPIWTSSFAPDNGIEDSDPLQCLFPYEKYLAVGLSRVGWSVDSSTSTVDGRNGVGSDIQRILGQRNTSDNLLQIWRLAGTAVIHQQTVTYKPNKQGGAHAGSGTGAPRGRPKGSTKDAKKGPKKQTTTVKKIKKGRLLIDNDDDNDNGDDYDDDDNPEGDSDFDEYDGGEDNIESDAEADSSKKRKTPTKKSRSSFNPAKDKAGDSDDDVVFLSESKGKPSERVNTTIPKSASVVFEEFFEEVKQDLDKVGAEDELDMTVTPTMELNYAVHLNQRGPVWQASWSPVLLPAKTNRATPLGVLAVVCGDGACLVLVLPRLPLASNSSDLNEVSVLSESSVCRAVLSLEEDMITCINWNPHEPFELICGTLSGLICIWSLSAYLEESSSSASVGPSPVLLTSPDSTLCDPEVDTSTPCFGAITSVQVCPHDQHLLLSGGCDGNLKVWDIHRPFQPLLSKQKSTKLTQVEWDPCGIGLYCADESSTAVSLSLMFMFNSANCSE